MKQGSCFTCLGFRQGCNIHGCVNAATTPQDLLCQDCIRNPRLNRDPPNVLLCGLGHFKPTAQELIPRFERWINGFSARNLGAPISVNFLSKSIRPEPYPEAEREKQPLCDHVPPNRKVEIIYNTSTGDARPVDRKTDHVVSTSTESVGYVMQLLYFGDQKVLTLYDSGANQNIVQAKLARDAGFLQLSSEPVTIGVAGGGKIITEHGQYKAVLGPCQDGCSYSLDCQAVDQITQHFPLVNLDPIVEEARRHFPADTSLPKEIGGDEVKLLVGIRQTELTPRHLLTLPSGVCVFESKVTDVFGSNICFGGPHSVFTDAYCTLGVNSQANSIQSMQALFTEVATAYIKSPWTFIHDEEEDPCDNQRLFEYRAPEPPESTDEVAEIAVEVAPELCHHKPEDGEPSSYDGKLNTVITGASDGGTSSRPHIEVETKVSSTGNLSPHSINIETKNIDPTSEVSMTSSDSTLTADSVVSEVFQTGTETDDSLETENSTTPSDSAVIAGMVRSDLDRVIEAYSDCHCPKNYLHVHHSLTTPPMSEIVVDISPEAPPTHPAQKEVAGYESLHCLLEMPAPSTVLTKKQKAMANYRAQLHKAVCTLPMPTATSPTTLVVPVALPTPPELSPEQGDACTFMNPSSVLCEVPPVSAAHINEDSSTIVQPTEDKGYDTMTSTIPTNPALILPANSTLPTTLRRLTDPMTLASPVTTTGLPHRSDLVMPTRHLTTTILMQLPSTGSHAQPHRPPNLKDPPFPWVDQPPPHAPTMLFVWLGEYGLGSISTGGWLEILLGLETDLS